VSFTCAKDINLSSPTTLTKDELSLIYSKYKVYSVNSTDPNAVGCAGAYIGAGNLWHFVNKCSGRSIGFQAVLQSNSTGLTVNGQLRPHQDLTYRNHPYPIWNLRYLNDWFI
jgi:hypothetical protein